MRRTRAAVSSSWSHMSSKTTTYDAAYYASDVEDAAVEAGPVMADTIIDYFRPTNVVDVGRGSLPSSATVASTSSALSMPTRDSTTATAETFRPQIPDRSGCGALGAI